MKKVYIFSTETTYGPVFSSREKFRNWFCSQGDERYDKDTKSWRDVTKADADLVIANEDPYNSLREVTLDDPNVMFDG